MSIIRLLISYKGKEMFFISPKLTQGYTMHKVKGIAPLSEIMKMEEMMKAMSKRMDSNYARSIAMRVVCSDKEIGIGKDGICIMSDVKESQARFGKNDLIVDLIRYGMDPNCSGYRAVYLYVKKLDRVVCVSFVEEVEFKAKIKRVIVSKKGGKKVRKFEMGSIDGAIKEGGSVFADNGSAITYIYVLARESIFSKGYKIKNLWELIAGEKMVILTEKPEE